MSRAEHDSLHTESANRKFYQLPSQKDVDRNVHQQKGNDGMLLRYIEDSVIGKDKTFSGPFGLRKALYCDYIASGRSLSFLEDYIQETVLPDYGNTHTTTTVTSLQTTLFRHEARDIIRNAVNASEHDAVIFSGSGCTGAVHKLIHALNLQAPPIVVVGPYDHHSTLLPWREVGSEVIRVRETPEGLVDLEHLKELLQVCQGTSRQLIGCFAVASNITGILTDVDSVTTTLHQYGALALWDYATGAPYLKIDMNPVSPRQPGLCHKDAIFISAHKFVGGVQTPGILVVKKKLLQNPVPSGCGGGSVFFVRRDAHRYLQEAEMREEGGTPAIVESIRAGLVFQLKEAVGSEVIMHREHELCRMAFSRWKDVQDLVVLGSDSVERLPIFSIMVRHQPSGLYLHYNFVCTLLNDLFGIQARGGCACAGPYAQDLLGINEELAKRIEDVLVEDSRLDRVHLRRYREYSEKEILRPGFARLSLPYFLNEESVQFVLDAVEMVAQHGWKLLPQYNFNPETGEWRHRQHQVFKDRKWLGHVTYRTGHMTCMEPKFQEKGPLPQDYQDCLEQARKHFVQAHKTKVHIADQTVLFDSEVNDLRWFLLPSESQLWLQNPQQAASGAARTKSPFHPAKYPRTDIRTPNLFSIQEFKQRIEQAKVNEISYDNGNGKTVEKSQYRQSNPNESTDSKVESRSNDSLKDTADPMFQEGLMSVILKGFNGDSLPQTAYTSEVALKSTHAEETSVEQTAVVVKAADSAIKTTSTSTSAHSLTEHSECNTDTLNTNAASSRPANDLSLKSTKEKPKLPVESAMEEPDTSPLVLSPKCTLKSPPKVSTVTTDRHRWHPPPNKIFRPTIQAIEEYDMISDGDRVLVCLSGGKDSLSLLHTLRQYQFYGKKKGVTFELGAVTVDPQTSSYDPSPLKAYLAQLNVPYFYEEQCIMESAQSLPYECASICSFCSRMKRGRIYHCARREGYNVLALGQHLDDLAESFLMSMFHNGILRTMKACYTVQQGDLKVIRPFVYVREKDLRHFAEQKHLPVISENCPACFEAPKERHRMKQLLASQEVIHPRLFHSLLSAIKPVMSINKTGVNVKTLLCQQDRDGQNLEEEDIDEL